MRLITKNCFPTLALALFLILLAPATAGQDTSRLMPVGTKDDASFATALWKVLEQEQITGKNMQPAEPFLGAAKPHGWILELVYRNIDVNGHTGFVVVKRNYDQEGLSVQEVIQDRARHLSSFTVMFQREAGYDEDNQNWFWAKYRPDGTLFQKKIEGVPTRVAGRFLKGKQPEDNGGCIYCHASAGGGDYIFYPFIRNPQR
jgi:hypothetical protein